MEIFFGKLTVCNRQNLNSIHYEKYILLKRFKMKFGIDTKLNLHLKIKKILKNILICTFTSVLVIFLENIFVSLLFRKIYRGCYEISKYYAEVKERIFQDRRCVEKNAARLHVDQISNQREVAQTETITRSVEQQTVETFMNTARVTFRNRKIDSFFFNTELTPNRYRWNCRKDRGSFWPNFSLYPEMLSP